MNNKSEEEKDKIISEYLLEMDKLMNRQDRIKQSEKDKVIGMLTARKRVHEELEKEEAVAKELDRITKKHVSSNTEKTDLQNGIYKE